MWINNFILYMPAKKRMLFSFSNKISFTFSFWKGKKNPQTNRNGQFYI